ncbi:MAG: alpha-1,2-fucosyltransferase [Chloroflexota bacterium]
MAAGAREFLKTCERNIMNSRATIITRIMGGIGNQLFCYAAARRLALKNNAELIIDDVSGFARDFKYRRQYQLGRFAIACRCANPSERMEPLSLIRRYLKRAYNRRWPFEDRSYIQQDGVDFDPRLFLVKPRGRVYLDGYWQSEGYFKDVENIIRADLKITQPVDGANLEMAERIRACLAVAVHVRFFDAPDAFGGNNAPSDYYQLAIKQMESILSGAHYFVFSDQPDAARNSLPLPGNRITFVSHNKGGDNAYADLWLMTQCRHFVIANSTFSWWGAWLAANADKQVIAPGFQPYGANQVCSWNFDGQLPKEWIKIGI